MTDKHLQAQRLPRAARAASRNSRLKFRAILMTINGNGLTGKPVEPIRRTFGRFRREIRNWYSVGALACVALPTRFTPRRGLLGPLLGNREVTFRIRDGSTIRCRLKDAGDIFSVYVHQDYAGCPISWDTLETVIDVGATVGSFTIWAARQARGARLFAIEPNPEVYRFLLQNVIANGLRGRATIIPVAVGGQSGYGTMVQAKYSTLATVTRQATSSGYQVRISTLDELLTDIGSTGCDLLKLDCEGAEYDILLGCTDETLRRIGAIICEYHPVAGRSPDELVNRLSPLNFRISTRGSPYGFLFAIRQPGSPSNLP